MTRPPIRVEYIGAAGGGDRRRGRADPHGIDPELLGGIALVVVWGLLFAASMPIRQTYLNDLIPSQQRATILSFDSLMSSSGGVVAQPVLGRAADVWGYPTSYVVSGMLSAIAVPFMARARREEARNSAQGTRAPSEAAADDG